MDKEDLESIARERIRCDDGCEVSLTCLLCPLPLCRFEGNGKTLKQIKNQDRDVEILHLFAKQGSSSQAIATLFGVSIRTVGRIINRRNKNEK